MRTTGNAQTRARLLLLLISNAAMACVDRSPHGASRPTAGVVNALIVRQSTTHPTLNPMQRLVAADSCVAWGQQPVLIADIDCDGKPDSVFEGRSMDRIYVGVIRAAASPPEVLRFGTHGGAEDALSSSTARLTLEGLDYDPREADVPGIEGFQRSTTCQGLNLDDGDTDPMHMFWNHTSQHLDWWRE